MLKGSKTTLNGDSKDTTIVDRPRKKLSFREPEIMGYYMQQMTQSEKKKAEKSLERERMINLQTRISEEEEEDEEELEVNSVQQQMRANPLLFALFRGFPKTNTFVNVEVGFVCFRFFSFTALLLFCPKIGFFVYIEKTSFDQGWECQFPELTSVVFFDPKRDRRSTRVKDQKRSEKIIW